MLRLIHSIQCEYGVAPKEYISQTTTANDQTSDEDENMAENKDSILIQRYGAILALLIAFAESYLEEKDQFVINW